MIKKRLKQIKEQVLQRPYPHAVLSWRYLLPNQSKATLQHKKVFLEAWHTLPRTAWTMIALYSTCSWFIWGGWVSIYRTYFKLRPKLATTIPLNRGTQLAQLWWLTFAHSIPPHYYYDYQLYRFPEKDWHQFIYNHELPHWHRTQSPNVTKRELELITDKQLFSEEMHKAGLPAIPTLYHLKPSDTLKEEHLFQGKSLFIKPVTGSQKRDSYELLFDQCSGSYQLLGQPDCNSKRQIQSKLQDLLSQKALLIQPLLQNHESIEPFCVDGLLATIRLITRMDKNVVHIVDAILEIPLSPTENTVLPYRINISSGKLEVIDLSSTDLTDTAKQYRFSTTEGTIIPEWFVVIGYAQKSHYFLPNIQTIGWDLCITTNNIFLIEGNFNWGVDGHQLGGAKLIH